MCVSTVKRYFMSILALFCLQFLKEESFYGPIVFAIYQTNYDRR